MSDCLEKKKFNFVAKFQSAGLALWKIVCPVFKASLNAISTLISTETVVVAAELQLASVFIDNFVVFPLNAAKSSIDSVTSTAKSISDFGFTPECPDTGRFYQTVSKHVVGPLTSLGRGLQNTSDFAKAGENDLKKAADDLNDATKTINSMLEIPCP